VSWAAPVAALHLVSGADQSSSTWKHSSSCETIPCERRRLERDLHERAQQRLVAVSLQLGMIQRNIRANPALAEQLASSAAAELSLSLEELRELARGIHPVVLDRGLAAARHANLVQG
jgi:signal transduction histidine kinase